MPALYILLGLLFLNSLSSASAAPIDDLRRDQDRLERTIAEARLEHDKLSGGLLKSLMAARLELLRTNAALVQQRIHALESGAKITIALAGSAPNLARAAELESDMRALEQRIVAQEAESAKYSGGLVKGLLESGIATSRMSLEMLNTERLKAKYGIQWLPRLGEGSEQKTPRKETAPAGAWEQEVTSEPAVALLHPTLSMKRFQASDYRAGVYEDVVLFDIDWDTTKLARPARAVKGVIVFADIFGESKFRIGLTIDNPLTPSRPYKQRGIGFKYNQFKDDHQWVRNTDLTNMKVRFEVMEVLYADGTTQKLSRSGD